MGMTTCPECGGKISTSARTCPHCGCDFAIRKEKGEDGLSCGGWIFLAILGCGAMQYFFG
ncbi:hypothetical protein IJT17_09320 [bacterium]|nr:hypothetical protein [bacterium]